MKKRARVTSDNVMRIIKGSDASLESKTGKAINAREARGKFSDFVVVLIVLEGYVGLEVAYDHYNSTQINHFCE